ncbi:ABC-three component system middle component 7 [Vreelandella venusta]|uniref:ABC-three component system middle component 7 n=1 Tax=Vreelandella venusta TaxID=44935 RepID=UPI0038516B3A
MLIPTKFTTLEESTIFKMRAILENRKSCETLPELLARTLDVFQDASEFLYAVDILYVLGALDVNASTGVIEYA